MNIYITTGVSPFILSVEDKAILQEGQTEWQTSQTSPLVTGQHLTCTQAVFNAIKDVVGTMQAPALIANASATPYANRLNCYVENGSLKVLA
ncbi:hypothetical protein [Emticicia sp. 17c]|uniref:hypothetical protein n=1 Tax=Emticicia sp. 17c TaxID=3127704 RepID=UPI00301D8A7B